MINNDGNSAGPDWPELLGRLFDKHAAALELYARQFCDCPEDIVQEAFIEFVQQKLSPRDAVGWLFRVVRNKAISALRAGRRRKEHEQASATRRHPWFNASHGELLDAQTAKIALEKLSPEEREIVIARIWGGLTFQQIAEIVGVTDSTVFRRYETALGKLRQKLRVSCPTNTK